MAKILLTGARGFVGRNILEFLRDSHEVLSPSRKDLDLLNGEHVCDYLRRHSPDMVIHAAGRVGGLAANAGHNYTFFHDNLLMGVNLIKASSSIPFFFNLGSSCIYPKDRDGTLKEEDLMTGPLEPTNEGYAMGKLSVMKMGEFLSEESGTNFRTIIPCNLYGPYDNFDPDHAHLIPSVITKVHDAALSRTGIEIWGTGEARREFMYVSDLIDFIGFAVEHPDRIPIRVNVGYGQDHSVKDYYNAVCQVVGYSVDYSHDLTKPTGMKRKLTDISVAKSLGWEPRVGLAEGIERTYEYFRRNCNDTTVSNVNVES